MLKDVEQKALIDAIDLLKLDVTDKQIGQIGQYFEELLKWNKTYNLTGFKTFQENLVNNLLDCLSVTSFIKAERLVDVGTGAGLPGVLLAIVNPEQQWTLLDANGKKTRFLQHIKQSLGLNEIEIVNTRVEQFLAPEKFDAMCSRAFDKIPETLNKSQHLLKPRSSFYAMKGKLQEDDLQNLPPWARVEKIIEIKVPLLEGERHLIHLLFNKEKEE